MPGKECWEVKEEYVTTSDDRARDQKTEKKSLITQKGEGSGEIL